MAKKKQGDGSVFQRKDGRWEGRIVVGYKENGYAQTKNVTAYHGNIRPNRQSINMRMARIRICRG